MRDRRRERRQNQPGFASIGTASLILILLLLCLVTFAILTYNSAASDARLSQKAAQRTTAWQEASNQAQKRLGEIDDCLETIARQSGASNRYLKQAQQKLAKLDWTSQETCAFDRKDQNLYVDWMEPVADNQALCVRIRITVPKKDKTYYTVESYQTRQTADWKGDMSVKVYQK